MGNAAPCRHAEAYIDNILNGAKPADGSMEQPREFDFVNNLQTAQALAHHPPPRADPGHRGDRVTGRTVLTVPNFHDLHYAKNLRALRPLVLGVSAHFGIKAAALVC